ncbi:hypothetical protein [Allomesorhizobium camelthorni]|uniref:Fenitrothion hydrolase n=1 Tax=Allomesorhizobium camelthorni TaxID=475069 RepID=A0A6G4W9L3_9HYPH|nr:hypothetical protein [Mesorhizobium camelthorni]NGO51465.1 hypothetical protein [Mesorhizobium camelthorni]
MSGRTEGGNVERKLRLPNSAFVVPLLVLASTLLPTPAFAHASERGHVLLLPTGYYVTGGAMAVAASFLMLAMLPPNLLGRVAALRVPLGRIGLGVRMWTSLLSFAVLVVLVAAGFLGSRDPLSNPLPLTVWTLLWVGVTLVQGAFGNLWAWINPWYGPWRLVFAAFPNLGGRTMPAWLGYWPALFVFAGFAWFELVYPAPDDPARLALAVALYWAVSFACMLAFGYENWSQRGEFLSVFFRMVSRFGIVEASPEGGKGKQRLFLCFPGAKLWHAKQLPPSGMFFLLLTLSSVSFDGFSKTFLWLGANDVNPLEFPGRSALVGINSAGLALMFVALAAVYLFAVRVGERLAGSGHLFREAAGLFVWSIVPIALAYHFSHYLTALLVNGQYALVALSDPFAQGWNLFGTAYMNIAAGFTMGSGAAWTIWNFQATAIIGGHVLAVLIAHALAFRLHPSPMTAAKSQLPLTVLMIFYTVFGLWLLSTPTAG